MLLRMLKLNLYQYAHQTKESISPGLEVVLSLVFHLSKATGLAINNGNRMVPPSWIRNVIDNLYHLNDPSFFIQVLSIHCDSLVSILLENDKN